MNGVVLSGPGEWTPEWAWSPAATGEASIRMDVPLGDLFSYGCTHTPHKIALADRRDAYDYATLEALSCSMAAALQHEHRVSPGDRVMVIARKSCLVPPLAVAIWKLGAVYMPVDAEAPPQRLAGIAEPGASDDRYRNLDFASCRAVASHQLPSSLPLSLGGYVYQFNRPITGDIMRTALMAEKITHLIAVSTLLTMISEEESLITAEAFPQMEMVMTGAELCAPRVISLWKQRLPDARVINAYGPTEVTIVCACHEIEAPDFDRTEPYPIGRPLEGVTALLLDRDGRDVTEPGVDGELCLGGKQVMTGYANQPEETAKRIFIRDGVRFYRSGDICRRGPNGDIHFVGRNDAEVKIAGRRIHLGEVQNCCLAIPGVERAVVGVIRRGERQLIAAIIVGAGQVAVTAAQRQVGEALPAYMQPAIWALTDANVLSRSGKTDDATLLTRLDERYAPGCGPILTL